MSEQRNRARPIVWLIAVFLPVALLTASGVPWLWGFALTYVALAFALQKFVRLRHPGVERFVHILVLSGSSPFVVRSCFGPDLTIAGAVHVAAVLAISIGIGYLLAERITFGAKAARAM